MNRIAILMCGIILLTFSLIMPVESDARTKVNSQTLYVPVYSNIYYGNRDAEIDLTTTISIRNTSRMDGFKITKVEYYDSEGKLIRSLISEPVPVAPLESKKFVIKLNDDTGGSGANLIVSWEADSAIDAPIVETISLGTGASFAFSFLTQGVVIE